MPRSSLAVVPPGTDADTPTRVLVGGVWREGSGTSFPSLNPASGQVLRLIGSAGPADVADAVAGAREAMDSSPWRGLSAPDRARLLWRVGDLIDAHADELARLETLDNGQPFGVSRHVNIPGAAEHFRYYAGWVTKLEGRTAPLANPDVLMYTRNEPVGVCALITPWNFPLMMAAWKLAPALACGNAVILKPAEQTPLTALRLGDLMTEAGFPPGVVSVLAGGADVGAALVAHPGVDKVSFTGSTEVGHRIARASADRFTRVTLELGGKTPMIIARDADLDQAVPVAVLGAMFNTGQVCAAFARIYVDSARVDEFTSRAAEFAAGLRVGDGLADGTDIGPLVTAEHRDTVEQAVAAGVADGAQVVTGGQRPGGELERGYFYQPTILAGADDQMAVTREEIFGPVVPVLGYADLDEAIARANDTAYGLAGAVFSRDVRVVHRVAARLRVGAVFANMLHVPDAAAPWGGFGASGVGREMGPEALAAYTEVKGVFVNLGSDLPGGPPPDLN